MTAEDDPGTAPVPARASPTGSRVRRPSAGTRTADAIGTVLLMLVLLALVLGATFVRGLSLHEAHCDNHPRECDEGIIAFAGVLLPWGPWIILLAAIVLSIVVASRGRLAFWVPLVAILCVIALVVLWNSIVLAGLG